MRIYSINIPLDAITLGANLILLGVYPFFEYKDGEKTDILAGYRYLVVEDSNFEKFSVKILSSAPAITPEQIAAAKTKILVRFENAFARPYQDSRGEYQLSFSASAISVVTK